MKNKELVSIIIPAYNAESYIQETLQSIYDQTYQNFEVIIVDDGSTDLTRGILKKEASERDGMEVISSPNNGVSVARNIGLSKAKGEYIALLDADDVWDNDNLEQKVRFLNQNREYGWVYSNLKCISESGEFLYNHPNGRDDKILENILLWNGEVVPGPCSNIIYRSELALKTKFDPNFSTAADQDFTLQLAFLSQGKILADRLVSYRIVSDSMSKNISVMEKDHIGVFLKAKEKELFPSKSFERKCFANLYKILAGSWLKDGHNPIKSIKYIIKSILIYPRIARKYFS